MHSFIVVKTFLIQQIQSPIIFFFLEVYGIGGNKVVLFCISGSCVSSLGCVWQRDFIKIIGFLKKWISSIDNRKIKRLTTEWYQTTISIFYSKLIFELNFLHSIICQLVPTWIILTFLYPRSIPIKNLWINPDLQLLRKPFLGQNLVRRKYYQTINWIR